MNSLSLVSLTLQLLAVVAQDAPVPVVLWHGMGDSAAGMIGIAVRECWINVFYKAFRNMHFLVANSNSSNSCSWSVSPSHFVTPYEMNHFYH